MATWPDLHHDVLEHIITFLPLPDHHRFSSVCQNWRWVVKHRHCPPAPQLPWLVMRQEASSNRRKFFNLSENREYYIDIPELYGQRCCGSSFGWLCTVDEKFRARLLNPFTREVFELPELPKLDEPMYRQCILRFFLSDDPGVKSDFTVVFLYSRNTRSVYWRPGDIAWTYVRCPVGQIIQEAVFVQGTLYFFYAGGSIYTIELGQNSTARLVGPKNPTIKGACYLVDFMGKLLLVHRNLHIIGDIQDTHIVTENFKVDKVDLGQMQYYPCVDLGDYAIFFGLSSPVVVDSKQFRGCKRNSIYFTDCPYKLSRPEYGCDGIGIYDMRKGTIEPYYPPEIYQPLTDPPIWLTPNCRKSISVY